MIYAFIADRCADLPVEQCCRALKVSKSAFYAWRHQQANPTVRMLADRELGDLIVKVHDASFGTYGALRVTAELRLGLGRHVNHKRVQRLMRERGVAGVTRRRRAKGCTRSRANDPRSDDLVHRQFRPDRPDRLWVQDITQHRTGEGWVYLAVVIDAWSRRVVGWSIADHLRAELVVDALDMARLRRQPSQTVVHSDHGSQGGFKWSSQHPVHGGVRWGRCASGSVRSSSIGGRCPRRVGQRWRGVRTVSGSGRRSLAG
jgi:transposase InsO family protein